MPRQQLQHQAQAQRLESMILSANSRGHGNTSHRDSQANQRSSLPSGNQSKQVSKKPSRLAQLQTTNQQSSSLNRASHHNVATMLQERVSDLNLLQNTISATTTASRVASHTRPKPLPHQISSASNVMTMIDTSDRRLPVDQTLANSFKFNPVARERNALQVSSSKATLPQMSRQTSQHHRQVSQDVHPGQTQQARQSLAPIQASNAMTAGASKQSKKHKARNNLEDQIARNLMPNFVVSNQLQQVQPTVDQGVQPEFPSNKAVAKEPVYSPRQMISVEEEIKVEEELPATLTKHLQNVENFTSSTRQNTRRGELPQTSSKVNQNVVSKKSSQSPTVTQAVKQSVEQSKPQPELEPLTDRPVNVEDENPFVGHETSAQKEPAFVPGIETHEIGCGPDLTDDEKAKENTVGSFQALTSETVNDSAPDKEAAESSDGDSAMAETLIQATYVEKKADRLIKEFQTASEDEAQIEQVKSAVKQIRLEEEKANGESTLVPPLDEEDIEEDKQEVEHQSEVKGKVKAVLEDIVDPQTSHQETPQPAEKLTGSSAQESANSLSQQSNSNGTPKNEASASLQSQTNNFNLKKSLLTSTGCGPDGSQENKPKMKANQKIKLKKKVDQTAHITKFSQSLVFNAIERVTNAGSELIQRDQDAENPIQQINREKILYDFDSEVGLEACRKYLECLENLFALSFLKRASRDYRQHFTAAYRVLYDNPVASPLNYLVEILDSAQESFPYLWVNGKKYEFSQMVLQQGNLMYQTFSELKDAISQLHVSVIMAKATMTPEYCHISPEELHRHRTKVERHLEQFDQDWSIYEKAYVTELMAIEADARRHVTESIRIVQQMYNYENDMRLRGKILNTSSDEEFNSLRNKFLRQISEINQVANSIGQGRDDLDVSVLIVADEVSRKVSASQSLAVRQLCTHIQKSFNNLKNLFMERYAENVEVVDPQLRNNPELVHLVARFEKAWCLGRTHIVPRDEREQLISFSQLIEGTSEKYPQFKEQVECSDAEIFLTTPYLLVLKSSLDTGKEAQIATSVCQRFFPVMFQKPEGTPEQNPGSIYYKFQNLKSDFEVMRSQAGDSFFDFYNKIEQQILFGISQTPQSANPSEKHSDKLPEPKIKWKLLESQAGVIKEIGMSMTRQSPTEWNEFMIVALGIPEDQPLPFLQEPIPQPGSANHPQPVDNEAGAGNPAENTVNATDQRTV